MREKCICFAYFGDGKFLGWYADSFGSIRKDSPKIYGDSKEQIETIIKNFNYKLSKIKEQSKIDLHNSLGSALLNNSLNSDSNELFKYKEIELRIVECPIYDGPNPDFDREAHKKWLYESDRQNGDKYHIPSWIYANYTKVKEWALNEPTEFLSIIKSE
jgi:hypothetical protein